jgi:hypothetical protein
LGLTLGTALPGRAPFHAAIVSAANVVTGILSILGSKMDLCEVICPFFELRSTQEQEG